VVFRFTPTSSAVRRDVEPGRIPRPRPLRFQHWKEKVRHRHEIPEGLTQAFLESETIDNVDADVLTAIYNSKHPPFFQRLHARDTSQRPAFFMRMRVAPFRNRFARGSGAGSNCNGGEWTTGIWYFQHLKSSLWPTPQVRSRKATVRHAPVQHRNGHRKNDICSAARRSRMSRWSLANAY